MKIVYCYLFFSGVTQAWHNSGEVAKVVVAIALVTLPTLIVIQAGSIFSITVALVVHK